MISILHRQQETRLEGVNSLYPPKHEPTHKNTGWKFQLTQFWVMNRNGIILLLIAVMILILLTMMGYATATRLHIVSTEANNYEHLSQIVTGGI